MMRIAIGIALMALIPVPVLGQEPLDREELDQAVFELLRKTYPPLEGRIEVRTKPWEGNKILQHEGKDVGIEATFEVIVKNVQDKDTFGFVPN